MNKIIYLDVARSIDTVRPAERKIFFDILPSRNYQVFALLKGQVKKKQKENIIQIDCSSNTILGYNKKIYQTVNSLLKEHEIGYIVVRNNVWLGLLALLFRNIGNTKKIFIRAFPSELLRIHNSWENNFFKKSLSFMKNTVLLKISYYIMKRFDVIFARSKKFAQEITVKINRTVYPLPMGFDSNWVVDKRKKENYNNALDLDDNIIIGYIGAIDQGRNIQFILNIFKGIFAIDGYNIKGLIVTEGSLEEKKSLELLLSELGLKDNLRIIGPYEYTEMPNIISIMTATISPIPPIASYIVSSPTKTVESIGLGVPVIGNGEIDDQRYIIENSKCGVVVDYKIDSFIKGIKELLNNNEIQKKSVKGKKFILEHRNYEVIADYFEEIILNES